MFFALVIPKIEFESNLDSFLPDNELVQAYDRFEDYFGDDYSVHLILVEEDNAQHDVLSPDALREQYDIYERCMKKANVDAVLSIASVFDELYSKVYPDDYTAFSDLSDEEIQNSKELLFQILNGTLDISYLNAFLQLNPGLTLDDLKQIIDIFFDKEFNYNSPEPRAKNTIIVIFINGSIGGSVLKEVSLNIQSTINTEDSSDYQHIKLKHTGGFLISAELDNESEQSFIMLGIAIIVLLIIILSLSFRRVSYVLIPLVTLALAVLWTFGTMILLGIEFTIITVAIIPLIIGLGVDYSVYISKRYQEELRNGFDISTALARAIGSVGTAMFLAVFTTIIAFMSNLTSNIAPIRNFGLICGLGILYAFILSLTFHTSVRWLVDIKSSKNPIIGKEKELYVVEMGTKTASTSVIYYPVLVLILVVIITVSALNFGLQVRTEFNNNDFLPNNWESMKTQEILEENFNSSSFTRAYILLEDNSGESNLATVGTLTNIQRVVKNIENDEYIVRISGTPRIESILDYVEEAIKNNITLANEVDKDNDLFPDNNDAVVTVFDYLYQQSTSDSDTSSLQNILHTGSGIKSILYQDATGAYRATVIRVYVNAEESSEVREMYSELQADMKEVQFSGLEKSVTGSVILTVTTMDALQDSQIWSTSVSILFALVVLILIYRRISLGIIAIIPVLISSVWILGTMYLFGISINVFTVSITALTIGLGIDYAIHIIERYREERKKAKPEVAINKTIHNTGAALFISGITTVCGFIVLTISRIPPIQHFGIITAMTIIYSSILALVVIPILLLRREGLKKA
jgi:hydrophobe/amphiphile efflux-3 (HAE3) family protein